MHKLATTPITIDCFETDDLSIKHCSTSRDDISLEKDLIPLLERLRKKYLETKDIRYWKELIRWLPESWLQTRTVTMDYENVFSIIKDRNNHKLKAEWCEGFFHWATKLPYAADILFWGEEREKIYAKYC